MMRIIGFQRLYSLSELMIALLNGLENVVLKIAFPRNVTGCYFLFAVYYKIVVSFYD